MICPTCVVERLWPDYMRNPVPCPECQGSGIAYCCDKAGSGDEEVVWYGDVTEKDMSMPDKTS